MTKTTQQALAAFAERYAQAKVAFRAAFFDMDGILFDSMPAHCRSWLETAERFGLRMTPQDVYMFEGQTGNFTINLLYERTFARAASLEECRQVYETKSLLFGEYNVGGCIPQAPEVVAAMSHLERVLVTGSSQSSLLDKVSAVYPGAFSPERMVTGLDVRLGKPDPEPYLMALAKAGVSACEALVVENAPMGVRSAHRAGCFTIAINTGPLADDVLWVEGADLVLPDMQALLTILPDLGI